MHLDQTAELPDEDEEDFAAAASPDDELESFRSPLDDPLENLYTEVQLAAPSHTRRKVADPSLRNSLAAVSKRMRDQFLLPENWERTRGVAVLDKDSMTLIGNFSEYVHRSVPGCRKLLREHVPIAVSGTEFMTGWLGDSLQNRRDEWAGGERARVVLVSIWLDELMVGSPLVELQAYLLYGGVTRAELASETQLASASGNTVITLPAGCNIFPTMSVDSKIKLRKELGL